MATGLFFWIESGLMIAFFLIGLPAIGFMIGYVASALIVKVIL